MNIINHQRKDGKMKVRYLVTLIFMLFLTGCATTVVTVKDPTGRMIPNPHYYYQVIGYPVEVIFYYTAFEEVEDLDGTILNKPTFLSLGEKHKIDTSKYKTVTITIEVNNPYQIEYELYYKKMVIVDEYDNQFPVHSGGRLNSSNSQYRQFVYKLPLEPNVKEVDYAVSLEIADQEVLRLGNFNYIINSNGKGVVENEK
jgi:hypothetical protein